MKLTEEERSSPLWARLKAECETRLFKLRTSNDNDLGEIQTAKLRGQIMEIRRFLDMGTEKPKIEME